MMDIVDRIKEFTLNGACYNSANNCMLLDAISEVESLRAQLAEQPTPSQSESVAWTSDDIDDTNCNSDTLEQFCRDNIRLAPFFAMLACKLAQPTSQSEPFAYYVYVEKSSSGYFVDSLDDPQCVDDCTNADAIVTPLFTKPQSQTVKDSLEQAAKICDDLAKKAGQAAKESGDRFHHGAWLGVVEARKAIRALIQTEKG